MRRGRGAARVVLAAALGAVPVQATREGEGVEPHAAIATLRADARVERALAWLAARHEDVTALQIDLARIPSPDPFSAERAAAIEGALRDAGIADVGRDSIGNVIGRRRGSDPALPAVVLSAHLDTVFHELREVTVERQGEVLRGPGVADDAAGLAALVHLVAALGAECVPLRRDLVIAATVGEEGEGDLCGVRHLFAVTLRGTPVHAFLTLDLGSRTQIVASGLGSRRLQARVRGPGGHSWGDFGRPNPIHALARGVNAFLELPRPAGAPRSSFNVGVVEGGRGVNAIPEDASLRVDLRSEHPDALAALEADFRAALVAGVAREESWSGSGTRLDLQIEVIGDRPVGATPAASPFVRTWLAAFESAGLATGLGCSSTDANLPMSLGIPAVALPHGAEAHDAHSHAEWCDVSRRRPVLEALLVGIVALAELETVAAERAAETTSRTRR